MFKPRNGTIGFVSTSRRKRGGCCSRLDHSTLTHPVRYVALRCDAIGLHVGHLLIVENLKQVFLADVVAPTTAFSPSYYAVRILSTEFQATPIRNLTSVTSGKFATRNCESSP